MSILCSSPAGLERYFRLLAATSLYLLSDSFLCRVETVRIDTAALKPTEVLVRVLAAPITPSDVSQVAGFGANSKVAFPRVAGNEGVGVVEAVGGAVSSLTKGDFVVASTSGLGACASATPPPGNCLLCRWVFDAGTPVH